MVTRYTEADFDRLSWHDCHIWGLDLCVGDPDENDWTSDLVLDIDYIVEWVCGVTDGNQFRVAPATLAFHGVTDPRIERPEAGEIAFGAVGFTQTLLADPVLTDKQHLSLRERGRISPR